MTDHHPPELVVHAHVHTHCCVLTRVLPLQVCSVVRLASLAFQWWLPPTPFSSRLPGSHAACIGNPLAQKKSQGEWQHAHGGDSAWGPGARATLRLSLPFSALLVCCSLKAPETYTGEGKMNSLILRGPESSVWPQFSGPSDQDPYWSLRMKSRVTSQPGPPLGNEKEEA